MSKASPNGDYVRCNLKVTKIDHPEIYNHLVSINDRAEEIRHLIRLGLMVKNGNMPIGMGAIKHNTLGTTVPTEVPIDESNSDTANGSKQSASLKSEDNNLVIKGEPDLDFGDELLGI